MLHLWSKKCKKEEMIHHYLMGRKVNMKLHQKMNKQGPFSKKEKMKAQLSSFFMYHCKPSWDCDQQACYSCYALSHFSIKGGPWNNGEILVVQD